MNGNADVTKQKKTKRTKAGPPPPAPDPVRDASEAYGHLVDVVAMTKALTGEVQMLLADVERGLGPDEQTVEHVASELRAILHLADAAELVIRERVIGEETATKVHEECRRVAARRVLDLREVAS